MLLFFNLFNKKLLILRKYGQSLQFIMVDLKRHLLDKCMPEAWQMLNLRQKKALDNGNLLESLLHYQNTMKTNCTFVYHFTISYCIYLEAW